MNTFGEKFAFTSFGEALLGCIETDVPANHRLMGEMAEVIMLEPAFSNKTLRELDTLGNYGIVISRITRLGNTFVPHGDSEIFRNDVLTIVGQPEDIAAFRKRCRHRSSVINSTDIFSLAAGVALGIAIGCINLGGGFCLGTAGGPLLVALVLGHFGHIGPVVASGASIFIHHRSTLGALIIPHGVVIITVICFIITNDICYYYPYQVLKQVTL